MFVFCFVLWCGVNLVFVPASNLLFTAISLKTYGLRERERVVFTLFVLFDLFYRFVSSRSFECVSFSRS